MLELRPAGRYVAPAPSPLRAHRKVMDSPMQKPSARSRLLVMLTGLALLLSACQAANVQPPDIGQEFDPKDLRDRQKYGTVFGNDAFVFSTERPRRDDAAGAAGIGVNAYLWRATLETVDFVPLASADPFGGLIITEWYQPAEVPDERFKLNILIRDRVLRADAVKVSVFRQVRAPSGEWVDAPVAPGTARALEDKILTRARELRIVAVQAGG